MSKKIPEKSKIDALKKYDMLNSKADLITDPLFMENDFFDPYDLMQVKYEMLRHVDKEGESITCASSAFGFSRLSFYRIRASFKKYGLVGLLLKKRGPRSAHKLSSEIMEFVEEAKKKDQALRSANMKELIEEHFQIKVHKRSIERALTRRKKN